VQKQLDEGMESTPVMVETDASASDAASADSDSEVGADEVEMDVTPDMLEGANEDVGLVQKLGHTFDSELQLTADERADLSASVHPELAVDTDSVTPTYNADGLSEELTGESEVVEAADADSDEDMALLQIDEDSDSMSAADEAEIAQAVAEASADAEADEATEGMAEGVELVEVASNPHAPRSYARMLHRAESPNPVLAEMSGHHTSFHSAGGLARTHSYGRIHNPDESEASGNEQAEAEAAGAASRAGQIVSENAKDPAGVDSEGGCAFEVVSQEKKCIPIESDPSKRRCTITIKKRRPAGCKTAKMGIANSPRRFRLADALYSRPRWNRWDPTIKPHPDAQRAKAREMWLRLMQMTYDRLEGYCSTRLPEQFTPFCRPLLRRFRVVAEGIRYGDRPNQICMRTRFCPRGSYVRRSPHNVFKHLMV